MKQNAGGPVQTDDTIYRNPTPTIDGRRARRRSEKQLPWTWRKANLVSLDLWCRKTRYAILPP